jgi:hypothetical protein
MNDEWTMNKIWMWGEWRMNVCRCTGAFESEAGRRGCGEVDGLKLLPSRTSELKLQMEFVNTESWFGTSALLQLLLHPIAAIRCVARDRITGVAMMRFLPFFRAFFVSLLAQVMRAPRGVRWGDLAMPVLLRIQIQASAGLRARRADGTATPSWEVRKPVP